MAFHKKVPRTKYYKIQKKTKTQKIEIKKKFD